MPILENLILSFASNHLLFFLISIIATALWGDASYITLIALGFNFKINLLLIAISCYFGTIVGDTVWFYFGHKLLKKLEGGKIQKNYDKLELIVDRFFKTRHLLLMIFVKFLYGTRVIATIYLSKKKVKLLKFLEYDLVATIPWVVIFGLLGYGIAIGLTWVMQVFKSVQLVITLLVLFFIILNLVQREINNLIERIRVRK